MTVGNSLNINFLMTGNNKESYYLKIILFK